MFASVGYWLDQDYAGRGVMPRAVAMVIDHCFFTAGLHRIEIAIRPENSNSLRVVEKLEIREIGYAPKYLHIDGAWRDHRHLRRHQGGGAGRDADPAARAPATPPTTPNLSSHTRLFATHGLTCAPRCAATPSLRTVDPSALIFVALAVAWAVYLIPKALEHHEESARTRTVERFSATLRVLARREPISRRKARLVAAGSAVE